ncbi:SRPBCC family protein [Bradyrhizobium icense]|uniref:SRPBCC family protein n=1 Tax=Bradyrhizobium icense TaxID=1274631 RepID=UPI001F15B559|nr:SRPBCC family protein [Bradyrhizobium icense]
MFAPHSWPEWLAASQKIEGPNQPLKLSQTFREKWQTRRGTIELHWTVTESNRPSTWTCKADTDFIGPIVIRYTFADEKGHTRYTRELTNPDRPSEPTDDQLLRMDEEARIGLGNIKKQVEWRFAARRVSPYPC